MEEDFGEMDENMPQLSLDDVVEALDEFIAERENRRNKLDSLGQTA